MIFLNILSFFNVYVDAIAVNKMQVHLKSAFELITAFCIILVTRNLRDITHHLEDLTIILAL